jgi:hypothetical protein
MLRDLAIVHTHSFDSIEMDLPACRRDTQKLPLVRAVNMVMISAIDFLFGTTAHYDLVLNR